MGELDHSGQRFGAWFGGAWVPTGTMSSEGDASNLHELKDHTFELVVSIFGAMFAPKPFDVAKEMVRVTRPGGRM